MKKDNLAIQLIATFGFSGYLPIAPGTCASLLAVIIWFLLPWESWIVRLIILIVTFLTGLYCADRMEKSSGTKDPTFVVIDEVAGIWLALLLFPQLRFPGSFPIIISIFFVFRIFDIIKIFPLRKLEKLPGGLGIMLDDLFAGLYTALVIFIILKVIV
jgi:phosphatidylglycerophosphatase A